jgi:hypothetical protein
MRLISRVLTAFAVMAGSFSITAQNPQLDTPRARRFPTVLFSSVMWSADPAYFSIALDSSGTATYQSLPASVGDNGVPYTMEFQVSDRTRRIAFRLAQGLNYFSELKREPVPPAQTSPVRTLAYIDTTFNNQFTYGAPSSPDLEEITSVFEEISETFEIGRRLAYLEEHEKGAIAAELDRLEAQTKRRHMREFQALTPILHRLAEDQTLGAGVRNQAEELLRAAQGVH